MADLINTTNPLSSLSYTNKDFVDIYTELLNLAKTISSKWDPTISNESDPGVVLLKMNAIIADKNNYNIDKSILETFPGTVAQENNARHLFEQLGYKMKWYQAAETMLSIKFLDATGKTPAQIPDSQLPLINIPIFTEFTDIDNTVVYTSIENADIVYSKDAQTVKALEGSINNYTINNREIITLADIDEYNRIYFDDVNIAENGVFVADYIDSVTEPNWVFDGVTSGWKATDNLYTVENSPNRLEKHFKLGVLPISNTVYIEFPDNVSELIGKGIRIKYITTKGNNVATLKGDITKFNSKVPLKVSTVPLGNNSIWFPAVMKETVNDEEVLKTTIEANGGLISVYNITSSQGGSEPQSISSAYNEYQKTIGTFNTLVTLRDYINAINTVCVNNKHVSNGFVTDRTDDISDSISVIDNEVDYYRINNYVLNDGNGDRLSAFDLKLYLLQYAGNPGTDTDEYITTFDVVTPDDINTINLVKEDLDETKSIQHDFKNVDRDKLLFIKNRYPLAFKVYTSNAVDLASIVTIKINIESALRNNLNSQKIKFGEEINYDYVYETILNSDPRIKQVLLEDIQYTSYGIYLDNNGVQKEAKLNNFTAEDIISEKSIEFINEIYAKSVLNGNTTLFKQVSPFNYRLDSYGNQVNNITKIVTQTKMTIPANGSKTINKNDNVILYADNLNPLINYSNYAIYFWRPNSNPYKATASGASLNDSLRFLSYVNTALVENYTYLADENNSLIFKFEFDGMNWNATYSAGTVVDIPYGNPISESNLEITTGIVYSGIPTNNSEFTVNVGIVSGQGIQTITADSAKRLKSGDAIAFLWRNSDEETSYHYRVYTHESDTNPLYFKPSFNMTSNVPSSEINSYIEKWINEGGEGTVAKTVVDSWNITNTNRLSSTSTISILEPNIVDVTKLAEFTVISNNSEKIPGTQKDAYKLTFAPYIVSDNTSGSNNDSVEYYYCILQENEYLCYINGAKTELAALGSGTKIMLNVSGVDTTNKIHLYVPIVKNDTQESIISYGLSAVNKYTWLPTNIEFNSTDNNYLFDSSQSALTGEIELLRGVEQEIIILGEGYSIGSRASSNTDLDSDEDTYVTIDNQLYYRNLSDSSQPFVPLAQDSREWTATMHMNLVSSNVIKQELQDGQRIVVTSPNSGADFQADTGDSYEIIPDAVDPLKIDSVDLSKLISALRITADTEVIVSWESDGTYIVGSTSDISATDLREIYGIVVTQNNVDGESAKIVISVATGTYSFLTNIQLSESSSETNIDNRWWYNKGLLVQPKYGLQMYYWKKANISEGVYNRVALPKGTYLIKSEADASAEFGTALYSNAKYHYYMVNNNGESTYNISSDIVNGEHYVLLCSTDNMNYATEKIKLNSLEATVDGVTYGTVISTITNKLLNRCSAIFDFTYQALPEYEIAYPTDSLSLLDYRHWYNKFTICQLNTKRNPTYNTEQLDIPDNPVITIRR